MAAMPPTAPGSQPPGPPPPPQPPAGPGVPPPSYAPALVRSAPQPYTTQYATAPPKVHRRTFLLTVAQLIVILLGIGKLLAGIGVSVVGVLFLTGGRSRIASLPGYDQAVTQFGNTFLNAVAVIVFSVAAYLVIVGLVDLILGVTVGRPSNISRWFIIVLDVLSILYYAGIATRTSNSTAELVVVGLVVLKVVVLYALAFDPATRRDFAGTSR